jgi:hypothetical protein
MRRQAVESSSIAEIGYDARRRVLEVRFRNGGLYRYFDVPASRHRALVEAESVGGYLNRCIKGRYRYVRVEAGADLRPLRRRASMRRRG